MTLLEITGRKKFGDISVYSCEQISPLIEKMQSDDSNSLSAEEFVLVLEHVRTCADCQKKIVVK